MVCYTLSGKQYDITAKTSLYRRVIKTPAGIEQKLSVEITDKEHDQTKIAKRTKLVYKFPGFIKSIFKTEKEFRGFMDIKPVIKELVKEAMNAHDKDSLLHMKEKFDQENAQTELEEAVKEAASKLQIEKVED